MKLLQLQILTNDIKSTIHFYQDILGLRIVENNAMFVSVEVGNSVLKFVENRSFQSIYHLAFNIPKNKLQEAIEWSENKLNLVLVENQNVIAKFENWNANSIYFYDNNGNLLEFIARQDFGEEQYAEFDAKSILNISEIGIVNENPLQLANELIVSSGLAFFDKNANSELFSAIGNDEGLLIIVKPNRNWYPTQIPAEINPVKVRIENNGNRIELDF